MKKLLWLGILLVVIPLVLAPAPPQQISYKGVASINGVAVAGGTEVAIFANNGTLKMNNVSTLFANGFYHLLKLVWDDPNTTGTDEGVSTVADAYEFITFTIDGLDVTSPLYTNVTYGQRGAVIYLDLDVNTTADIAGPVVNLEDPNNGTTFNARNVTFSYNVTDFNFIANCSLFINNQRNQTNLTVIRNVTQYFEIASFPDGSYNWSVECFDNQSNRGVSATSFFTISVLAKYRVILAPWGQLIAGKPVGINITVEEEVSTNPVEGATVQVIERNGYGIFAMTQYENTNVTTISITQGYTDGNGETSFTIVPTGGFDTIGIENFIGDYNVTVKVFVDSIQVNESLLNVSERTLVVPNGSIIDLPNFKDIKNFRANILSSYLRIKEWMI